MSLSAVSRALALLEILTLIMDKLADDRQDLLSCALVSRRWSVEAVDMIWHRSLVKRDAILNISPERRQLFAAKTRNLHVRCNSDHLADELAGLAFTSLRKFEFWFWRVHTMPDFIPRCFGPHLREVVLGGEAGGWQPEMLDLIKENCVQLRSLSMQINSGSEAKMIPLLTSLKSLTHLCIFERTPIFGNLLHYLARESSLRHLELAGALLSHESLTAMTRTVAQPFQHLESLEIHPTSYSSLTFLPDLQSLRKLHLRCNGPPDAGTFGAVSALTELRDLTLWFEADVVYSEEVLRLRSCQRLQHLSIGNWGRNYAVSHVTDDKFEMLFEHLPLLETLLFRLNPSLTCSALFALAKHCPLLTECAICGKFTIEPLERITEPLFPNLRSLSPIGLMTLRLDAGEDENSSESEDDGGQEDGAEPDYRLNDARKNRRMHRLMLRFTPVLSYHAPALTDLHMDYIELKAPDISRYVEQSIEKRRRRAQRSSVIPQS